MSRQGKRGAVTIEYQRIYSDNDRGSPVNREAKQSVLFHVDSSPVVMSVTDSPRLSPTPKLGALRRQRDATMSSQESLNASGALIGQESPTSSFDLKDGEKVEFRHGSPSSDRSDTYHSGSPEKFLPLSEQITPSETSLPGTASGIGLEYHSSSTSLLPGLADKKTDSFSDSTSEKDRAHTFSANRHTRERSFERSLDNILDKCSEKSLDLNLSVDSWNGTMSEGGSRGDQTPSSATKGSKGDKKKKGAWYTMLNPTYKSRSEDFRKTFKDISRDERLIVDYSCALQKDILVQGRMYIAQNWVCFYANIFRWETVLAIPCKEITAITKERTARVIPNAIQISTASEKYFFTSYGNRDKTYMMLFRIWQNVLMDQPMPPRELWQWVHYNYGDELGLTSSDDDYMPPPHVEDLHEKLKAEEDSINQKDNTDSSDHMEVNDANDLVAAASNEDTDALVSDEVFNQSPLLTAPTLPVNNSPPTDYGDTTDDSDNEVACSGHEHLEKLYLDEVFNLNVDKVFENIFTDSPFFRVFVGSRKTFDLNLAPWQDEPDEEGNRVRNISYTLTLNNSIGPRISPSTERQVCYKNSRPGRAYFVDCECCNGGIPYGDSFFAVLRYCLTRVSINKCRVRVTSELRYRKSVMGMFKSMIEKSAVNGLTDYFRSLSAHLRGEAERQECHLSSHQHQPSKKKLRRRRKPHTSVNDSLLPGRSASDRQTSSTPPSPVRGMSLRDEGLIKLNADSLVRIVIVILILLVIFNAVLFYKLWAIEASTTGFYSVYTDQEISNFVKVQSLPSNYQKGFSFRGLHLLTPITITVFDSGGQHPRSQEDWTTLLRQQRSLHQDEVSKWQEILQTSVQLLDQMKCSLRTLQESLAVRLQTYHSQTEADGS